MLCGLAQKRFQSGPLEMLMKRMTYGAANRSLKSGARRSKREAGDRGETEAGNA